MAITIIVGLAIGTMLIVYASHMESASQEKSNDERLALATTALVEIAAPYTEGFMLHILCDKVSSASFFADEEGGMTMSRRVYRRNMHLEEETGAIVRTEFSVDFDNAAAEDILSGTLQYNLYSADAAGSLSKLLSGGRLHDFSDSQYINLNYPWYDKDVTESLSLYQKTFLLSSAAQDARKGAVVIVFNRSLLNSLEFEENSFIDLTAQALDGDFTIETLLAVSRTAAAAYTDESEPLADVYEATVFYGFSFGEKDTFPIFAGFGGTFADSLDSDGLFTTLDSINSVFETVFDVSLEESVTSNPAAFENAAALFGIAKISDIESLKTKISDVGILPLPKLSISDEYRSFVDLRGTPMLAIPAGISDTDCLVVEYLIDRMAFLSEGYITPLYSQNVTQGNADDLKILDLIYRGTVCDFSNLFGYGDIAGLFADSAKKAGTIPVRDYYNREQLYKKAFEIIGKRILNEE